MEGSVALRPAPAPATTPAAAPRPPASHPAPSHPAHHRPPLTGREKFAFFAMVVGMFMAILDIQIVSKIGRAHV